MLPGLYDYHNGPCRGIIISQFPLSADYKVDFAFVSVDSMRLQFTLVEIEDPDKTIFNEDYSFSQPFNHALQQIRDYKRWAENNKDTLLTMFADLFQGYNVHNDIKAVQSYLVCGRRRLVDSPQKARERWSSLQVASKDDVGVMTYDRLMAEIAIMPMDTIQHTLAVCSYRERGFFLKPETLAMDRM